MIAWGATAPVGEIRRNSGSQFDPAIVEIYEGLAAADAATAADGRAVTPAIATA